MAQAVLQGAEVDNQQMSGFHLASEDHNGHNAQLAVLEEGECVSLAGLVLLPWWPFLLHVCFAALGDPTGERQLSVLEL